MDFLLYCFHWASTGLEGRHWTGLDPIYQIDTSHGVPHGSVLGPILFTLQMLVLGNIIGQLGIHFRCSADDTQL